MIKPIPHRLYLTRPLSCSNSLPSKASERSLKTLHKPAQPILATLYPRTRRTSRHLLRHAYRNRSFHTLTAMSSSSGTFHPLASSAFTTSGSSGLYDRARPSYPPETLNHVFNALHQSYQSRPDKDSGNGLNIVELGAGTGIFTRVLLSPPAGVDTQNVSINKLLAVEPSVGMRQGFRDATEKIGIKVGDKGVEGEELVQAIDGTFDNIPVQDGWADAVIIAQAFHWSHPHYSTTLVSLARALRPGAPLILVWNLEDRRSPLHPWVPRIRDIYEAHEKGTPQYRHGWWKAIFDLPEYKGNFKENYDYLEVKRVLPTTEDQVVDRVVSKSYITALVEEDKKAVEDGVRDILKTETKVWIDESSGVFEYPYATDSYIIWRL
ncbi:hypothetical protein ABW19_dt0204707 [Dactylella cylindrospora]|nr:hypothetical protein ABW19_dt0204707 [Dactylella cylindrospora]